MDLFEWRGTSFHCRIFLTIFSQETDLSIVRLEISEELSQVSKYYSMMHMS